MRGQGRTARDVVDVFQGRRRLTPVGGGAEPDAQCVERGDLEHDGQSAAALGERLVLDGATMTGLVDRRVNLVCVTPAGVALRAPLGAAMDALNADVAARVGPGRLEGLRATLRDVAHATPAGTPA